ncbi:DUF6470 family protein [Virgibacillus salexigens]|uniref:YviE n=1 Tax=Virgibacillus kapii TaxID=1638645 RepID=A0ABQ2DJX5_9BACI|nr:MULTISPECIES: DUF6470 family protein [Virgibacillus]GGJ60614.1 hypothetical protein GCM10007111_23420 [Virgibacillus kapii]
MNIPQLRMHSQMAQIQISQESGEQTIRQPKADVTIQQPKPEVSITTTPAKLSIDQSKAFADMNLMRIFQRNKAFAQEGQTSVLEGISRRVRQGNELMKLENEGSPIVNQAVQNAHPKMKTLGITFIPSLFSVKLNSQPAEVNIEVETKQPIINATPNKVEHRYERGNVAIEMKQYQDLTIEVIQLES